MLTKQEINHSSMVFWHSKEPIQLRLFIKVDGWGLSDVMDLVDPTAKIKFSSVGGYDHNNSYVEHNVWMGVNEVREPFSIALQVYRLSNTLNAVRSGLRKVNLQLTQFSFEDSNDIFYQGSVSTSFLLLHVTVPKRMQIKFSSRLIFKMPALSFMKQKDCLVDCLYLLEGQHIVGSFPRVTCIDSFRQERLHKIINSLQAISK